MKKHKVNSTFIEVDWDNFEDVRLLFNAAKGRMNELNPNKSLRWPL